MIVRDDGAMLITPFTKFDLLFGFCPNKHVEIFGFYHQCDEKKIINQETLELTLSAPCGQCGCVVEQKYPLHWEPRNWQI